MGKRVSKGNAIPTADRMAVRGRDRDACQRCAGPGTDWHHRRRRRVKSSHYQHCRCNGVLLCRTCHDWAHSNPAAAREGGFIVSAYDDQPYLQPIKTFMGWVLFKCDGGVEFVDV
jgi:hypothetical protein